MADIETQTAKMLSSNNPQNLLRDSLASGGFIPLDAALERNRFPPFITAFLLLVVCLVLFNIVGAVVGVFAIAMQSGAESLLTTLQDAGGMELLIKEHMTELLIGNTVGQILCIGLPALLFARMTSSRPMPYLRLRSSDIRLSIVALLGLVAFQPVVSFLGEIWSALPWPDSLREFEAQLMEPVNAVLKQPNSLIPNILMIAVTPAICEELLFRGYLQRNAERAFGIVGAIIVVGFVFGAYHLQPTKLLPLSALGALFAWMVWRSGSLWPAIVAHFVNNAMAVSVGTYFARKPDFDMKELENMSFDWYIVALGLGLFVISLVAFDRLAPRRTATSVASIPQPQTSTESDNND